MQSFTTLTGIAAPLPMINVDTDKIIPKQFLKTIARSGLGKSLFFEMRYGDDGAEVPGFVLNRPAYRNASILVAGENFGCGSSREHAPLAIKTCGVACVIAATFARIFYRNALNIGLPILECPEAAAAIKAGDEVAVDFDTGVITDKTTGLEFRGEPFPPFMQELIAAGGLAAYCCKVAATNKA